MQYIILSVDQDVELQNSLSFLKNRLFLWFWPIVFEDHVAIVEVPGRDNNTLPYTIRIKTHFFRDYFPKGPVQS